MDSSLEFWLSRFDGFAVSMLSEARIVYRDSSDYLHNLVQLCFDTRPNFAAGASWMLKAELEDGNMLEPDLIEHLSLRVGEIRTWAAKLHVCQLVGKLDINLEQAYRFVEWAEPLALSDRPFLRAWSAHVIVHCGVQHDKYLQVATKAIERAEADGAASVRARARQLRKMM